jgi:hypothetical protein
LCVVACALLGVLGRYPTFKAEPEEAAATAQ